MANVTISLKNEARVAQAWKKAPADMGNAIAKAVQRSSVFMTGQVKEHIRRGTDMWKAPLDTGRMMGGIHPVFSGMKAYLRPASFTPYAEFVHEGTRFMQARPFFEIAAKHEERAVQKMFLDSIELSLKKLKV